MIPVMDDEKANEAPDSSCSKDEVISVGIPDDNSVFALPTPTASSMNVPKIPKPISKLGSKKAQRWALERVKY